MGWKKNNWNTDFGKKYRWKRPNLKFPMNKSLLIVLILILVIGVLSYFNYTTGNYVKILEGNKTNIEGHLKTCNNQNQFLSSGLNTCNTKLNTCNDNLSNKSTSLNKCENEKSSVSDSLSNCNNDLNSCENVKDMYSVDLNSCNDDLNRCNNAKSTLRDNYAEDYCCLLNKTHYTISGNKITCGDSGTSISC
jgi:hypothetical protein